MDLPLKGIYSAAIRGIKNHPLVYLLLLIWGLVQGIILIILFGLGTMIWAGSIATASTSPNAASAIFYITVAFLGTTLILLTILSAATRAGVLSFGAKIRRGLRPTVLDFFKGIMRFTLPLFVGGLVVGMLTSIPSLIFFLIAQYSLEGIISDIFTSGWNFGRSIEIIQYIWNLMMVAGFFHIVIFFWIAPWDEMVVLYRMPFPEALVRSFRFVFSKRHFFRVLALILANVIISQLVLVLTNMWVFIEGLDYNLPYAYMQVLSNASSSSYTSFFQFILLPFFAYNQLFLLPWPESKGTLVEQAEPSDKAVLKGINDDPPTA